MMKLHKNRIVVISLLAILLLVIFAITLGSKFGSGNNNLKLAQEYLYTLSEKDKASNEKESLIVDSDTGNIGNQTTSSGKVDITPVDTVIDVETDNTSDLIEDELDGVSISTNISIGGNSELPSQFIDTDRVVIGRPVKQGNTYIAVTGTREIESPNDSKISICLQLEIDNSENEESVICDIGRWSEIKCIDGSVGDFVYSDIASVIPAYSVLSGEINYHINKDTEIETFNFRFLEELPSIEYTINVNLDTMGEK